ncbi:cation-dependent mannose-6-phosphate receptor [Denticeps clupeoides]|uniref:Cation-dependent mannose-6-phosphate receptor n=1 Tax=Denticeps clupeoides TaxID=299321 RepID=A0AAY4AQH2_9TELE|nr:cation-dependent mannose-6-phosphate receptor [Denticeps clupeoides]XP_028833431.1 cation-dependent mannose-6-phosphate receptor [Denticeps clupeoides]
MNFQWAAVFLFILLAGGGQSSSSLARKCVLGSPKEERVLQLLEPLANTTFSVEASVQGDNYTFLFKVCGDADSVKDAGVVQRDKAGKKVMVGNYSATQAIGGEDWVMLIYREGEKYDFHCSQESRKAMIIISCNRDIAMGPLKVVLEDRDRKRDCFYLFELDSNAVCPVLPSKLSAGSILLIIAFSCLAVYLIGGFLYQRLVVGAKGVEQFPNYAFWSEIGNLTADGCDFVCRSKGNRDDPPTYRGVPTETLGEESEERDDHLLPM